MAKRLKKAGIRIEKRMDGWFAEIARPIGGSWYFYDVYRTRPYMHPKAAINAAKKVAEKLGWKPEFDDTLP